MLFKGNKSTELRINLHGPREPGTPVGEALFGAHYFLGDLEEATSEECVERLEEGISGRKKWEGNIKRNANDGCESGGSASTSLRETGSGQGNGRAEGRAHSQRPEAQFSLCSRLLSWRVIPAALHI